MGSEWRTSSLRELGVQLIDCDHKTPKAVEGGIPYIGIPQMDNGRINFDANPRLISEEDFLKWTKKADPTYGDIILSRRCNSGETVYVPKYAKFALGQNLVLLRPTGDRLHPEFLRWVVQGREWWNEVAKYLNPGAIFESLKCADIPKFKIKEPPKSQQIKIANILSSINDKIDLNRQTNQTLEQMAQALFKSWFVDFDPVIDNALAAGSPIPDELQEHAQRRKQQLAKPDHKPLPDDIRQLFPSEFELTEELGWVPKGWKISSFGAVSQCFDKNRIPLSKKQRQEKKPGLIPYHGATSVMDYINDWTFDGIFLLIGEDGSVIKEDGSPFVQYIWGKAWVNNHAHVLQGKNGLSTEHLMVFMQAQNINAYITGAVQLKINQGNMNSIPFLRACDDINQHFSNYIAPLYSKFRQISESNNALTKLRDTLLPKLISGELRLPSEALADAEQQPANAIV